MILRNTSKSIPINPLNTARNLYTIYKQVSEIRGYSESSKLKANDINNDLLNYTHRQFA